MQRPRRPVWTIVALATLLAVVSSLVPAITGRASATWTSTAFAADRSGQAQIYAEDLGIVVLDDTSRSYLDLQFSTPPDVGLAGLLLAAVGGQDLVVGTNGDVRPLTASPNHMRLGLIGAIGCDAASSMVDIEAIQWQGTTLTKLDMTIICPDPAAPLSVEVRLRSNRPIVAHQVSTERLDFPRVLSGTTAPSQTLTLTSLGTTALQPSSVAISGTSASDFSIVSDACSGATLPASQTCAVVVGFAPVDGPALTRDASLTIYDNTINGFRTIQLEGLIQRPTTLSLTSADNPSTFPGHPTSVVAAVVPTPNAGLINYYVNGVFDSFTQAANPVPWQGNIPGTWTVSAVFAGTTMYAASSSSPVTQVIRSDTRIEIGVEPSPIGGTGTYDLTATVFPAAGARPPPGGTLTLFDDTTGTTLASAVLQDLTYVQVGHMTLAGTHHLRATYSGVAPYYLPSSATTTVDGPPADVPHTPWAVVATPGEGAAAVSWQPPIGDGGSPITAYVVLAAPGGRSCTTLTESCAVTGLTTGHTYTFTVTASNVFGSSPASIPSDPVSVLDTTPPTGTLSINAGAAVTKSSSVQLSVPANDPTSGVASVALSNDGSSWTTRPYAANQGWLLSAVDGTRTVYAKWEDGVGNWSAVKTDAIVLDATAPVATAPTRILLPGTAVVAGRVSVRLGWTGADVTSGVAHYELQQQTDGGAWSTVSSVLTATTIDRSLTTQHAYAFRVRAIDNAGNIGAWATAASGRLSAFGESSPAVTYFGSWQRTSSSVFWGGAAKMSTKSGSKSSLTFSGRSVSFVSRLGPTKGKARIYVDGIHVATIDLSATTFKSQRVVWARNFTTSGRHTVSVVVVGTAGRPRIDVDAFVVGT